MNFASRTPRNIAWAHAAPPITDHAWPGAYPIAVAQAGSRCPCTSMSGAISTAMSFSRQSLQCRLPTAPWRALAKSPRSFAWSPNTKPGLWWTGSSPGRGTKFEEPTAARWWVFTFDGSARCLRGDQATTIDPRLLHQHINVEPVHQRLTRTNCPTRPTLRGASGCNFAPWDRCRAGWRETSPSGPRHRAP